MMGTPTSSAWAGKAGSTGARAKKEAPRLGRDRYPHGIPRVSQEFFHQKDPKRQCMVWKNVDLWKMINYQIV